MERLKKLLSFPTTKILKSVSLLGLLAVLAGCPDGGGGGGSVPVPLPPVDPYGGHCGSCSTQIPHPVTLTKFETATPNGNVTLKNMELIGDASYVVPNATGHDFLHYEGPIALRGTMVVAADTQDTWSPCRLAPGTYSVRTYEVGYMYYGGLGITVPKLRTTSGGIEMAVANAAISHQGARIFGAVGVLSVAGNLCSANFMDGFY